jgi:2-polyprenyl-3-methyl-5-hydroxy-6-metoxy-1,4-benzoquinol methylase
MKTYSTPAEFTSRQRISCPLCGRDNARIFWQCEGFRYVRCPSCSLIYQHEQPQSWELKEHYDGEYTVYEEQNEQNFLRLALLGLKDAGFEKLEAGLPEKSILDIGCATGALLKHFKERGYRALGIELDSRSAEAAKARNGITVIDRPLEEAGIADESFGLVHSSHVIEHVTDPRRLVEESYRVLKPGGCFIVTTPNSAGLQAKVFKERWRSAISDHLTLFNKKLLKRLLRESGFEVVTVKTWGGWAIGARPYFLKRTLDKMAKRYHFGDVVLVAGKKR